MLCCLFGSIKSLADCNESEANCLASADCQRRIPMMMIRTGFMVWIGGYVDSEIYRWVTILYHTSSVRCHKSISRRFRWGGGVIGHLRREYGKISFWYFENPLHHWTKNSASVSPVKGQKKGGITPLKSFPQTYLRLRIWQHQSHRWVQSRAT